MCGRYALGSIYSLSAEAETWLQQQHVDLGAAIAAHGPRYNIAPSTLCPVIAGGESGVTVREMRWGLVPGWARDPKIGNRAINARVETVAEKPMFRSAFRHRRALVPASGYFEWRTEQGGKQPYYLHAPDDALLFFAGLWEQWRTPEDSLLETCTILTGAAGTVAGKIHDRQPVILPPTRWSDWCKGTQDEARSVLDDLPEAPLAFHPVSRAVGSPRNQGAELIEPLAL